LFLASSNYDYYYDDPSSNRVSAGTVAGITIGSIFLIGTLLFITIVYLRHHYVKQQNCICTISITQQPVQRTCAVVATAPPNPLPQSAYNTTHSSIDGCVFPTAPHQFSGVSQSAGLKPQYNPGPPPQYTSGPPPQYTSGPPPPGPQSEYITEPPPDYTSN